MLARETGGQGCLRLVVRITTGKTEEIEGESSPRGGNQREVQGVSRENAHVTAVIRLDCLEMRGLCFLYAFDNDGSEIIRGDSVVHFYRLRNVLDYILSDGHRKYDTFQQWRETRRPKVYRYLQENLAPGSFEVNIVF